MQVACLSSRKLKDDVSKTINPERTKVASHSDVEAEGRRSTRNISCHTLDPYIDCVDEFLVIKKITKLHYTSDN